MNQPKIQRLYEVVVVSGSQYLYFGITTNNIAAQEEHDKLRELNTEDRVSLFSHEVECNPINQVKRIL